jgi:phosphatidylglycerophosphatase A
VNIKFLTQNIYHFIALGFGSGLFKKGPGTAGSLAAIPIFYLLLNLPSLLQWLFVITLFFVGLYSSNKVIAVIDQKDPSFIVIDEIVAVLFLFILIPSNIKLLAFAFILFRVFDIFKPFPVSWAENYFKGALGIMMDDIVAALLSLLVIRLTLYVF